MNTRSLNTTLVAALLAVSGAADAGHRRGDGDGFPTRARVLASTPVFETINEPRRECWTETVGKCALSASVTGSTTSFLLT